MLPVGEADGPNSQDHPVGANCQGVFTVVSLKATVPPGIIVTEDVAPVELVKLVYGAEGIGPWTLIIPSGVLSKSGNPSGILSSLPGVTCLSIGISAYLI